MSENTKSKKEEARGISPGLASLLGAGAMGYAGYKLAKMATKGALHGEDVLDRLDVVKRKDLALKETMAHFGRGPTKEEERLINKQLRDALRKIKNRNDAAAILVNSALGGVPGAAIGAFAGPSVLTRQGQPYEDPLS